MAWHESFAVEVNDEEENQECMVIMGVKKLMKSAKEWLVVSHPSQQAMTFCVHSELNARFRSIERPTIHRSRPWTGSTF